MKQNETENLYYKSPTPGKIPILASSPYLDIHNAQELTLRSAYYTVEKISIGENGLNKEIMPAASQQTIEAGGYLIFKFY